LHLVFYVFQALGASFNEHEHEQEARNAKSMHPHQQTVNPKTGRRERIVVDLEAVYPDGNEKGREYCLEEIRARAQGLLDIDWNELRKKKVEKVVEQSPIDLLLPGEEGELIHDTTNTTKPQPAKISIFEDATPAIKPVKIPIYDDENIPNAQKEAAVMKKKARREERANRTQKIQVLEVRAEPQTGEFAWSTTCRREFANHLSSNKSCLANRPQDKAEEVS
jgi:checkpoint serine/threonine-protein kinase